MISVFVNLQTTDEFKQLTLGNVDNIILVNDGLNAFLFSQDGKSSKGILNPGETLEFKNVGNECDSIPMTIYIKSNIVAAPTVYRLWGW